jgi:hypothetical protein
MFIRNKMKTDLVSSAPKIVLTTLLSDKNVKVKNNRTKAQSEARKTPCTWTHWTYRGGLEIKQFITKHTFILLTP